MNIINVPERTLLKFDFKGELNMQNELNVVEFARTKLKKEYDELMLLMVLSDLNVGTIRQKTYMQNRINQIIDDMIIQYELNNMH